MIRCKLLCMLDVVEGKVCLLEAIRCALLCTLEGRLCLPEVARGCGRCPLSRKDVDAMSSAHGFSY